MSHPVIEVSVVTRRVPLANRWVSEKWEVEAVGPANESGDEVVGGSPSGTDIARDALPDDRWLWRGFRIDLHPSEAEGYYLNVREPEPHLWVMWRLEEWDGAPTARPWVVTASYNEAARMMDAGETVDSIPMPEPVLAWIEPWLVENYKPEPRKKKMRNQAFWGGGKTEGRT